jgi:RimJ/RimL family protein N-acetyltransferase
MANRRTRLGTQTRPHDYVGPPGVGGHLHSVRPGDWLIGYAGLSVPTFLPEVLPAVEVGWRLESWGQGHATWAGTVALRDAFATLGLERVISLPQVDNPASCRVAERLGMVAGRTVAAPATEGRGPVEVAVYEITAKEWSAARP